MADEIAGKVRVEEARRSGVEPLVLGVTIVDSEGVYVTHTFKKPAWGEYVELDIPVRLFDTEGELRRLRKLVEQEQHLRVARLRSFLIALQGMRDRYPNGLYVQSSNGFVTGEMLTFLCEEIANEA